MSGGGGGTLNELQKAHAKRWKVHQVVHWLIQNDMKQYTKAFYEEGIDGDILLNDMSDNLLSQLGVKIVHIGQFKRKLKELKKVIRGATDILLEEETTIVWTFADPDKKNEAKILREELAEERLKVANLEKELEAARKQITDYKEAFQAYKETGIFGPIGEPSAAGSSSDNASESASSIEPLLSMGSQRSQSFSNLALPQSTDIIANNRLVNIIKQKKNDSIQNQTPFAAIENVPEWKNEEVAYWLISINFPQYALSFYNLISDGDMLLHDVDNDTLIEDLNVKKIHSRRILQQIQELRREVLGHWDTEIFEMATTEPDNNRPTKAEIAKLKQQLETLQKEQDQLLHELENGLSSEEINDVKTDETTNPSSSTSNTTNNKGAKNFLSNKISALREERDEVKQQLDALQQKYKDDISANEANIDEMKFALDDLKQRNTQLTQELETAQTHLKQLNIEYENLKKTLAEKKTDPDPKEHLLINDEAKSDANPDNVDITQIVQKVKNMADSDPHFATPANVLEWTQDEVCFWLYQMQVEVYIPQFLKMGIDGNILVGDVNEKWLKEDLAVSKLHITKILRELEKLKAHYYLIERVHFDFTGSFFLIGLSEQQAIQILELTKQLKEERELAHAYETEIAQLKAEMERNDPVAVILLLYLFVALFDTNNNNNNNNNK
ncbi:viral A-type inclusion protein [Reticulomyxa filosa]|uniref:Viral A-type inclusion protein n=1 Tax=Reticulomyxa filosa TaxID=46433 RepID=X6N6G1_RETFI|nr:viral A-type inclusion protein [Reticulomyxa filosa]|eukprot:ETO21518.1 viral A-type inclusion protein [Reticulomyxa filosa]